MGQVTRHYIMETGQQGSHKIAECFEASTTYKKEKSERKVDSGYMSSGTRVAKTHHVNTQFPVDLGASRQYSRWGRVPILRVLPNALSLPALIRYSE